MPVVQLPPVVSGVVPEVPAPESLVPAEDVQLPLVVSGLPEVADEAPEVSPVLEVPAVALLQAAVPLVVPDVQFVPDEVTEGSGWRIVIRPSATITLSEICLTITWTGQVQKGNSTVFGLHLFSCQVIQKPKSILQE